MSGAKTQHRSLGILTVSYTHLHGVGASVVNALSEWLEVQVKRNGHIYQQRYERGKICYDLKIVGDCDIAVSYTHLDVYKRQV